MVIVGAGPGGIFTALELIKANPNLKICLLEKGKPLSERDHAKREDLTCGWAGAGAWSDGKIVYSLDKTYGGNLQDYVNDLNLFGNLMEKVDKTFLSYSNKDIPIFGDDKEKIEPLKLKAARNGMSLLSARIRHCGTDENANIMAGLYEFLKDKVDIKFNTSMIDFNKTSHGFFDIFYNGMTDCNNNGSISSKYLVLMPGRSGNKWFETICKTHSLTTVNNMIDIGVRVEFPAWVGKEIDSVLYEPKLVIRTPKTDIKARTFCYNPGGFVVQESIKDGNNEVVTVNGHSNSELGPKSDNSNFALLVSAMFTEPFNKPSDYGISVAKLCNLLSGGGALVQRLKDLKGNVRSTKKRMTEMNMQPTLKEAIPGDLSYALPAKQLDAILESIFILDKMMPGLNSDDTILYAPEIKFYSIRGKLTNELETEIPNLFAGGDGAGVSRGISQSSASGIVVANAILAREKK